MDVAASMEQIAERLRTIEDFRAHGFPVGVAQVGAGTGIVSYPSGYTFDSTYQRGSDDVTLPIVVIVGEIYGERTRDRLGEYIAGSGPRSIKGVVESGAYTAFSTVRVPTVEFDTVTLGSVEYLAAIFSAEISGEGEQAP